MLSLDLTGKTALVTGGSGELGRVISRTLAACGARVALSYLNSPGRAETAARAINDSGGCARAFRADVTDKASLLARRTELAAWAGDPHIVVCNAVVQYAWKPVLEQDAADYESQFRSCVMHAVNTAQVFAPAMVARRQGRIIAINTECAMQNGPTQSAYAAGKRGMDGVLRVLAREIGPHQVTVNQVAPGWTVSERDRVAGTERNEGYESQVPLRRRGSDQEVANTVAFLASDLASFITGAYLPVCGGNVMPCI